MKLNSLIDPKKKAKVLEAIKKGDGTILKKKKAAGKKPLVEIPEERKGLNNELIKAAISGDLAKVQGLLQKGADVDAKDMFGGTPMGVAYLNGHHEIVELLRKHGAKEWSRC